jgi:hypothetical protein
MRKRIMAGRGRYSYMGIRPIFALVPGACDTVASLFGANRHMFTTQNLITKVHFSRGNNLLPYGD